MLRALALPVIVAAAIAVFVMGGRVGSVDIMQLPMPLLAFAGASILVLYGLSRI
jgi:hypothetical protein